MNASSALAPDRASLARGAEAIAAALLVAVVAGLAAAGFGWCWGQPLDGPTVLATSALAAMGTIFLALRPLGARAAVGPGLAVLGYAAASLMLAAAIHDYSYDGHRYHQLAVQTLAQGWNPLRDPPVDGVHALWINGYAKGPWIWSAAWLDATGSIELGKSLHLWLAGSAGLLAFGALLRLPALSRRMALWVALLAALNPVLLYQWPTHMNDSLVGSLLLALASQAVRLALSPPRLAGNSVTWLAATLALALLPTVKSSGLAYGVLVCVVAGGMALVSRRWGLLRAVAGLAAIGLLPGALLLGWNPYVTNTLRHGHPFYPLAGAQQVDIISGNSPSGLPPTGRVAQWLGSLLSESHSDLQAAQQPALRWKWPGTVRAAELARFASKTDMRIGGFGPWFSLALALSLAAIVAAVMVFRPGAHLLLAWLALPGAILALTLAFPEPWWARYVPQMYLLPLLLVVPVLASFGRSVEAVRRIWARYLALGAAAALTVNGLAIAFVFGAGSVARELDGRAQLASLARLSSADRPLAVTLGGEPALGLRLSAHGVHWRHTEPSETCSGWVNLHQSNVRLCLPAGSEASYRDSSALIESLKQLLRRN